LRLLELILLRRRLVGQHQPRHQEHPVGRHAPDLAEDHRGLGVEHLGRGAQEGFLPSWQATV
jgi:hypothetical protein